MIRMARSLYNKLVDKKRLLYIQSLVDQGLKIGANSMPVGDFFFDPSHCFLIEIGENVTFAPNIRLIAHDASTKRLTGFTRIAQIKIGDNCFFGDSVTVLPGVTIGEGCIIGTSSLVTHDIPANSVAIGMPAKVISSTTAYAEKTLEKLKISKKFDATYSINLLTPEKKSELLIELERNKIAFIQ